LRRDEQATVLRHNFQYGAPDTYNSANSQTQTVAHVLAGVFYVHRE